MCLCVIFHGDLEGKLDIKPIILCLDNLQNVGTYVVRWAGYARYSRCYFIVLHFVLYCAIFMVESTLMYTA